MASLQSISAAIETIASKKEKLHQTLEALRSHSECLAAFNLQWKDLEDHIASIERSIEQRFKDLESREKHSLPPTSAAADPKTEVSDVVPRPELKSLCEEMDGKGLRSFIIDHRKDLQDMREELSAALRSAPDPAKLVLDSMEGFYPLKSKGDKDVQLAAIRRTCILLLDRLMSILPEVSTDVKESAVKLAKEWKSKISKNGENPLEGVAFLHLLAAYGLVFCFDVDDLFDIVVFIARRKQTVDLCRMLGLAEKIPDLITKLVNNGKQLDAVNFAYAFDVVGKFPPVPLLKAYLKESKKVAQEVRKKGNESLQSQNEAIAKELAAVRAVMKCIEEHNLKSEYPLDGLEKRISQLEKQKADKKRPAPMAAAPKPNQQQPANKRPRPAVVAPAANAFNVPSVAQINQQPQASSLLVDRVSPYLASAGPHGLAGPGAGTSALYDHRTAPSYLGAPLGYNVGGRSPLRSHLYPTDLSSSLYDKAVGYSSYTASSGLQHGSLQPSSLQQPYHQSYYP